MPMQLSSLEVLEQAQFPQAQARAIVRVLEADATARREELATKSDLLVVKNDLLATKNELKNEITHVKHELELTIREVKVDMVRWTFSALMGQTLLIMGIMYFLLQNAR